MNLKRFSITPQTHLQLVVSIAHRRQLFFVERRPEMEVLLQRQKEDGRYGTEQNGCKRDGERPLFDTLKQM
ncbi:hypothetical protein ROHU_022652 [Labeo rohita]|uniref:Uncharacterized protein n=1 Tax=Labeo rohita TaxID=84645 RepID=A0A498MUX9_LABRO|nr:hypothetical protein ROHU_022652 [Labeo rohita]